MGVGTLSKPSIIVGEGWINDKLRPVVYIKAKDCDFDKNKFIELLAKHDGKRPVSEIHEVHIKHRVGYHHDYGDSGYWQVCSPSERGASLHYYAETEWIDNE